MSESIEDELRTWAIRHNMPISQARPIVLAAGLAALDGEEYPQASFVRAMQLGAIAALNMVEEDRHRATSRAWKMADECGQMASPPARPRRRSEDSMAAVVELKPAASR